jgi:hypothetical protein
MNRCVVIATLSFFLSLAVNARAEAIKRFSYIEEGSGQIRSMTLTGDDRQTIHNGRTVEQNPTSIAIDSVHSQIYWTQGSAAPIAVRRADLDGGDREDLVPNSNPPFHLSSMAVDAIGIGSDGTPKIYFGDTNAGTLMRANLNGTGVELIAQGGPSDYVRPFAIELDSASNRLFWASYTQTGIRGIVQAHLDGTDKKVLADNVAAVALSYNPDDDMLYWLTRINNPGNGFDGVIQRMDSHGGPIETLITLQSIQSIYRSLALDVERGKLYWGDSRGIFEAGLDGRNATRIVDVQADKLVLMVPEPSTLVLLGTAMILVSCCRRWS